MGEIQFLNWILTYFSLGLNCSFPVLNALFSQARDVQFYPELIEELRQHFNDMLATGMGKQSEKGWIRVLDASFLPAGGTWTTPQWHRGNYLICHSRSKCYRVEYDTYRVEEITHGDNPFISSRSYVECNGIKMACKYVGQSVTRPMDEHLNLWGAHAQIQTIVDLFCDNLDTCTITLTIA
jgi:hypothetical protein